MLVATERGVEAASEMMEAAKAVIRVAGYGEGDASLAPSADSRHEKDLNTEVRRSLHPVRLPDDLPKARRRNDRFRIFVISGCLVLAAASAVAFVTVFIVTSPPRSTNVTAKERIVDAILANSRFAEQPVGPVVTITPSPATATTPSLEPTIPAAAGPVPASPIRRLDDDEVAMLEERGRQLMTIGDVAAARLMMQRAAEAGSPRASLDLGATYDPMMPGQLALRGIKADVAMARTLYETARQFGSAAHRLELLANQYPE
jgi:hypothetical protein